MEDIIIVAVLAAILGLAAWYVIKAKKNGKKCIGCPDSGSCGSRASGCCGCNGGEGCSCGTDHK